MFDSQYAKMSLFSWVLGTVKKCWHFFFLRFSGDNTDLDSLAYRLDNVVENAGSLHFV